MNWSTLPTLISLAARSAGTTGAVLGSRLGLSRTCGMLVAHNRAISDDTLAVLKGDLVVVRSAVRRFKSQTLYAQSDIVSGSATADLASFAHGFDAATRGLRGQQLFIWVCCTDR
jgi:hypothetical protein